METTQTKKKPRLVFCLSCGEQHWETDRCPYCDVRPKPFNDRIGLARALREDEYGW